jgi:copper(I)-binding protein
MGAAACGDDDGASAIEVRGAWTRPTPAGSTTAAVYMSVRAAEDDTLVGASVDPTVAAHAMAHETVSSDGQLSMDDATGVALPGGETVSFESGGLHVMLEDLAAPLTAGQEVALTLDFEHAPDVALTVLVRDDAP